MSNIIFCPKCGIAHDDARPCPVCQITGALAYALALAVNVYRTRSLRRALALVVAR